MADYGLKIFDASGNVTLGTTDRITRMRYTNEVAAGADGSVTLSDIDGLSSVEISVGIQSAWKKCSHEVSRSGTTFSWTAQDDISGDSLIFLFLYN